MKFPRMFKYLWITILSFRGVIFCFLYAALLALLPIMIPGKPAKGAYVLLLMSGLWVTEVIPIYVTALVPLVFGPLLGIASASVISSSYAKDTNILFFGGLMMACAIENNYIHKRLAITILKIVGSDPKLLMLGFMIPSWFLSMWMSNTATTSMMITIVDPLLTELMKADEEDEKENANSIELPVREGKYDLNNEDEYQPPDTEFVQYHHGPITPIVSNSQSNLKLMSVGFSLSIAYASSVGGVATITGTPPNSILQGTVLTRYGDSTGLNFGTWMCYAFPISAFMFVFIWLWLIILFIGPKSLCTLVQSTKKKEQLARILEAEQQKLGSVKYCEVMSALLFLLLTILWMTRNIGSSGWEKLFANPSEPESVKYISDSTPAILLTILVMILPASNPVKLWRHWKYCYETKTDPNPEITRTLLPWKVALEKFPWGVFLVIGGGFALATIMKNSGLTSIIGEFLGLHLQSIPKTLLNIVCSLTAATMTEFSSNSATASIILPIVYGLCEGLGIHPFLVAFPVTVATSYSFALPTATPPNTIVFAKGKVQVKHMLLAGIPMNIVGCLVAIGAISSYSVPLFGLNSVPEWVKTVTNATNV
ncbi:Solute carrier family 13 member 2 isoform 2 [Schistosoma japonicum]|uniref:Solute carrier family 13 member 2 isoform 2 n=2 Tax=Schistosoma japonicum TaxID=6182 RepID=A0A4Z2DY32_SCHJA|nr:Solute carrier family 13 member 2 [Schistosoma japonicum]KAH8866069.1 Solute carrier family 13 member 2 [Schistosoma japonicum]TNN21424.1 Solute carrier family 13 member 2 isoform 2 [Schistosoma japonicum]TNN21425.1 Solute carrier family 13 member 2 isoform 2 [Schistosoma japonicum]